MCIFWHFLEPKNAPFWSFPSQEIGETILKLKGALNVHILTFSGTRNCTFLELLGTWYLGGLFGVKRGLKLTHFGIFWPQIMNLFGVFREAFLAFSGTRKCTFLEFSGTWSLFGVKRGLKCPYFGFFWCQKLHLFGVFRHLIFERPFWS